MFDFSEIKNNQVFSKSLRPCPLVISKQTTLYFSSISSSIHYEEDIYVKVKIILR